MVTADTRVPASAVWLGGLGAVPFIGLAFALPWLAGAPRLLVAHALVGYAAVILSFLGGVHWGLAIASPVDAGKERLRARLILSVMPSLAAWAALLVTETTGLFIVAAAIAAMLWIDIRATRDGEAPPWYPRLRIPLTGVVVVSLLFGAVA